MFTVSLKHQTVHPFGALYTALMSLALLNACLEADLGNFIAT